MRTAEKDPGIELSRILACMIVIGVHTVLPYSFSNGYDFGRTLIAMFFADGVGIFWMITGAFLFNTPADQHKKLLRKSFLKIFIPAIVISFIWFYFHDYFANDVSLLDSVSHSSDDYKSIIHKLIRWNSFANGSLWYVYAYMFVIACYPVLKLFVDWLDKNKRRIISFLLITFVLLIINDITHNELFQFSHHSLNAVVPASLLIIYGHIFYLYRNVILDNRIIGKCSCVISAALFFLVNFIRTYIQISRINRGYNDKYIMYWYTSLGIVAAVCVLIFSLAVLKSSPGDGGAIKIINVIGSNTFYIYLFHLMIRDALNGHGFAGFLNGLITEKFSINSIGELLYSVIYILTVFVICLCISLFVNYLKKKIKGFFLNHKVFNSEDKTHG